VSGRKARMQDKAEYGTNSGSRLGWRMCPSLETEVGVVGNVSDWQGADKVRHRWCGKLPCKLLPDCFYCTSVGLGVNHQFVGAATTGQCPSWTDMSRLGWMTLRMSAAWDKSTGTGRLLNGIWTGDRPAKAGGAGASLTCWVVRCPRSCSCYSKCNALSLLY
jgi:hypothetical protein